MARDSTPEVTEEGTALQLYHGGICGCIQCALACQLAGSHLNVVQFLQKDDAGHREDGAASVAADPEKTFTAAGLCAAKPGLSRGAT